MKTKVKKVYYCDYCKKHGLKGPTILFHEKHCTGNVKRDCRLCGRKNGIEDIVDGYLDMKEHKIDIVELMDSVNNCPACTLAVIRGAKLININFNYETEIKKWWDDKNEESYQAEMQGWGL